MQTRSRPRSALWRFCFGPRRLPRSSHRNSQYSHRAASVASIAASVIRSGMVWIARAYPVPQIQPMAQPWRVLLIPPTRATVTAAAAATALAKAVARGVSAVARWAGRAAEGVAVRAAEATEMVAASSAQPRDACEGTRCTAPFCPVRIWSPLGGLPWGSRASRWRMRSRKRPGCPRTARAMRRTHAGSRPCCRRRRSRRGRSPRLARVVAWSKGRRQEAALASLSNQPPQRHHLQTAIPPRATAPPVASRADFRSGA